jgi:methylenetetrahydrofolate dehydrogenase (NADP+)/methenyltetrahydrofolate cyclohydrolase
MQHMAAKIIDGKALAAEVRAALKPAAAALAARGARPGLAAIVAGNDPASRVYVRNKARACEETGVRSELHELPAQAPESAILERIAALNADPRVHGILVQLPLPGAIDTERVLAAVAPEKDVDGFHADNLGLLLRGERVLGQASSPNVESAELFSGYWLRLGKALQSGLALLQ